MEAMKCIMERASVREFRPDPVQDMLVDEILQAGIAAPSAGNCQDWDFIVVRRPESRKRLAEAAMGQTMLEKAPLVIVVCANMRKAGRYGERGRNLYSLQDSAAACQNIMLAAWDRGLGSCWVGGFDEGAVREALAIPEHVRPVAMIPIGYPSVKPQKPERWPLKDFVHQERF